MLKDVLRHSDAISLMPAFMVAPEVAVGPAGRACPALTWACGCALAAPG
ncbi:MAG: hypothetical protein V9E98_08300 [Candidatus Nanopelagicales bacterium]